MGFAKLKRKFIDVLILMMPELPNSYVHIPVLISTGVFGEMIASVPQQEEGALCLIFSLPKTFTSMEILFSLQMYAITLGLGSLSYR